MRVAGAGPAGRIGRTVHIPALRQTTNLGRLYDLSRVFERLAVKVAGITERLCECGFMIHAIETQTRSFEPPPIAEMRTGPVARLNACNPTRPQTPRDVPERWRIPVRTLPGAPRGRARGADWSRSCTRAGRRLPARRATAAPRVTRRDCDSPWDSPDPGPLFADPERIFTTATVLAALSAARAALSRARLSDGR